MSRTTSAFLIAATVALVGSACVSTQTVKGGPDPRAGHAPDAPPPPTARVVDIRNAIDPIITIRIAFLSGSSSDPVGKEGLTALTARLMTEATADLDASALADALFPLAAELSVQVDKDATVFLARVHKDHEAAFLKIVGDVLTRPRLDASDFARIRDEQKAGIESTLRTGNDEGLQREVLEAVIYDDTRLFHRADKTVQHPYAHTPAGTVAGLTSITLADVAAQRDAVFTVDRAVVGVAGAASDDFVAQLTSQVSSLPARGAAAPTVKVPAPPAKNQMVIVEKPSAGTAISVGFALPTLSRTHPDYPAMKLAETWFGEHRNLIGHLFHSMREVRGLNYGDYAYIEHFVEQPGTTFERLNIPRRSQYFSMWIRPVEHKNRYFATKMTMWELQQFVTAGVPDDESFNGVRSFVMGYWPSKEQEPMRRLGYAMDQAISGQPFDQAGLRERVASLSRADVNAAIARHLRADKLSWVIVTQDAAPLVEQLVGNAPATMAYDGNVPASVVTEDAAISATAMGLAPEDILVVPPTAVFER